MSRSSPGTATALDAAISGIGERCPMPVDVTVDVAERPPAAQETAVICLSHVQYSNGLRLPVEEIGERKGGHLFVVNASQSAFVACDSMRGPFHMYR